MTPSPCIQRCAIDPERGNCSGCLRTLEEIAAWPQIDDAGKRTILDNIARRRKSLATENERNTHGQS